MTTMWLRGIVGEFDTLKFLVVNRAPFVASDIDHSLVV